MIANVSPTSISCEHTLNTLRYADRVKELRKGGRASTSSAPVLASDIALPPAGQVLRSASDGVAVREAASAGAAGFGSPGRRSHASGGGGGNGVGMQGLNLKNAWGGYLEQQQQQPPMTAPQPAIPPPSMPVPAPMTAPVEKQMATLSISSSIAPPAHRRGQASQGSERGPSTALSSDMDLTETTEGQSARSEAQDWTLDRLLDAEDELVLAHRKHIEDSMALVRAEMGLLGEVDQPGSSIEAYVSRLGQLMQQKAAGVRELQAKVVRFQRLLHGR